MGVQLSGLVQSKEIRLEELQGRKIAIDAYNWLYQFLSSIRQYDGKPLSDSKGRVTSHLSGLFYRTMKLLEVGVRPVYVFDGPSPDFKKAVVEARRNVRQEAMKEWKAALERNDLETAKKYAQRAVELTADTIQESKDLLTAMGVPAIQAPSEGEAFCSIMCQNNDVWAVATQDFDPLLFGAPRLIRNLNITGKRKIRAGWVEVKPELILLEDALNALSINRSQLIMLGILVGTDYNPGGIHGYGPKKALDLVRGKIPEQIMDNIAWEFDISFEEIYDFFEHPPSQEYNIKFGEPDKDTIKKILCDEHDFGEERIDNALKKLYDKKDQSLNKWVS